MSTKTSAPKMTVSSSTPSRSSSIQLKQPRINTATRARTEYARLQQEEIERKKNPPPAPVSTISQRIKQRASSGIDWDAIKKERRRTLTEMPTNFDDYDDDEFF